MPRLSLGLRRGYPFPSSAAAAGPLATYLAAECGLDSAAAQRLVERCLVDGEVSVIVTVDTEERAERMAARINLRELAPEIVAHVLPGLDLEPRVEAVIAPAHQIDWRSLKGPAHYPADRVPDLLRAVAGGGEEAVASMLYFRGLREAGVFYTATPEVVPFLAALACEPLVPERFRILDWLSWFVFRDSPHVPTGGPWRSTRAIRARHDELEGLLSDGDPEVRAHASHLLAGLDLSADAIRSALRDEPESLVVASHILALACRESLQDSLTQRLTDRTLAVRLAAAVAMAWAGERTPDVEATIREGAAAPDDPALESWPWVREPSLRYLARAFLE